MITGSIATPVFNARHVIAYSFAFKWTGDLLGDVLVEVSNDETTWIPLTPSVQTTAGEAGEHMVNVVGAAYMYVRGIFEHTSGSGAFDVDIYWKK